MEQLLPVLLFAAGLFALIWGGDKFVDASSWIAEQTGVPKFIVGATIVSLATTLPELIVSLMATMDGSVDMAVGNAIGSVSANIGLIMGLSLLLLPGRVEDAAFWRKGMLMILATAFLGAFLIDGRLRFVESLILLAFLAIFVRLNIASMAAADRGAPGLRRQRRPRPQKREITAKVMGFALGLGGILLGAELLVDNGVRLARMLGAPEALIGLTFVAVGTSLPELITTLSAVAKREPSLSVGNIIGANIIDITLILASCAMVSDGTLLVDIRTAAMDIPVTLVLMLICVLPAIARKRFGRWQGALLLLVYGAYMAILALSC